MEISIRRTLAYRIVIVSHAGASINLGLLNLREQKELASHLLSTVWQLGPDDRGACLEWLHEMMQEVGMEDEP